MAILALLPYSYRLIMPEIHPSSPYNYNATPPNSPNDMPPDPNQEDTNQQEDSNNEPRLNRVRDIISTVSLFLAAPLFALVLILFVIQSYEVDGPSMQETLQDNDLLIVSKIPKTWSRITGDPYIPERGEIIIFSKNESLSFNGQSRQLVKRVIARPGERIVVKDGAVTVYNQQKPNGFNPDANPEYSDTISNTSGNVDITVPENQVFVMGDNRNNSLDSRSFGPVQTDDIVGKLSIRLFPLNKAQTF